ncbi:branched-chain amino acid ABC transporter permease [Microvirga massiliensis]|uniref:branched-chain amino acid ABC transporter permease n=1 Tax=Microvirga massiliensis TaxID=1033741 RepID=UPI00062B7B97|nr:branched-chain amino acid ABC transporter permease [Microvirga massiliensis]
MFYAQLVVNGIVQGLVIGLAALSITLVFGIARFPNAATGDAMTFGAYAALAAHKTTGSIVLGGMSALFMTGLAMLLAYWAVFRRLADRSVVALLVASIGVAFFIRAVLGVAFGHSQQVFQVPLSRPYVFGGLRVTPLDLQLALVALVALAAVFALLYLTSIGRQMRAVADNRDLARVSGIRPNRVMVTLWLLAGGIAGIAGMMLGIKTIVTPEFGWEMLLPAFTAAILGGIGSPVGAVVAGLILGIAQEVSTPFVGFTYKIALAFVIMLAVLLIRPRGLFGRVESVR